MTNYLDLPCGEFLQAVGMDGKKWADAFMQLWGSRMTEVDHGLMLGWFCNAIMAGYDEATRRLATPQPDEADRDTLRNAFRSLTDAERLELMEDYCSACGCYDGDRTRGCECWNDE